MKRTNKKIAGVLTAAAWILFVLLGGTDIATHTLWIAFLGLIGVTAIYELEYNEEVEDVK